jgi:GTA TIM-barrel-like domain
MATLALGALGAAAGNAFLPTGLSFLGQAAGRLVGAQIDQALFGASSQGRAVDGPRLSDLHITGSSEGSTIPRLYGRARIGGQLIWATALDEATANRSAGGSGKGGRTTATGVNYAYYGTFAIGLCAGEITGLGRVWADGREIDLSDFTTRLYTGSEIQTADPLIVIKQGGAAPAFRGLAYIVFEHMPLAEFGNRIPQLSFEVSRAVDQLEHEIRAVSIIPGSGEFVYAQNPVTRSVGRIRNVAENVHSKLGATDWDASLDQLQSSLPNVRSVSLVVSWFGTDLRAGQCQLRPLVERADKITAPLQWAVAGETRATAAIVSQYNDRSAYGGTPSDETVVGAIRDLRTRGLDVVFSPFVLMDIPPGNALPDPYSSAMTQPAYPWRGRITVSPVAGRPGSPDKTAAAETQISALIGQAMATDFAIAGDTINYTGPSEWTFRRFILHYAHLCAAAGGVDAFVLSSELRGLTTVRGATGQYPFVTALMQLAADVRAILGPTTKLLYAADWSEYFGHQPDDDTGDVSFHLDPLWASPNIDAIGIDVYWPLADWRDGASHIDATTGITSPHDLGYLKANLSAGEGFDWYYANPTDRDAQRRTPITDGLGKPWVYRYKDLKSWWTNTHYNRIAGIESTAASAWVPQSKPFWLMEIGCPAVDKGRQPTQCLHRCQEY